MTSTENPETGTEREAFDTETFAPGEACGVCHFPTGKDQICGNVVYANQTKGRLPQYCGQEGQAHWQAQHGTEGDPGHKSSLAGYPRRTTGLTKERIAELAAEETKRRGITRRLKVVEDVPAAPVADTQNAPATADTDARIRVPADLASALPESAVDALKELARLIAGRVTAVGAEMEDVRKEAADEVAEMQRQTDALIAELTEQREGLEKDRADAQAATERAETAIREAEDARHVAEGQLTESKNRVAELERQLAEIKDQHRKEIEEVRNKEYERFKEMMREFASTVRTEPEPRRAEDLPITEEVLQEMALRIKRNDITRSADKWHFANARATKPGARTLDHMNEAGYLHIGEGERAPVALTNRWFDEHENQQT
ncbi:hypothetical protein AB0H76_39000 [Nocardia sp. NPDC050712]|uniref:hypothetical protein n=1 Tax=Actinomycetes TaxID=1760 RepID=UPI0033CC34D1